MSSALGGCDVEAISERYLAAWVSLHTADTRFWSHLGTQAVVGRRAVREAFGAIFERLPDFDFEVHRVRYGRAHWVLDWALLSSGSRFDCLDLVELSPQGLVSRKDTFIDAVQMQVALAGATR